MKVGFVGTGAMGAVMVRRLLDTGHDVVVHNRTRANASALEDAGAGWADSPAGLASTCEIVLGCMRDGAAIEAVYLGSAGLLAGTRPGQVLVEHGTFAPALARRLAAAAAARSAAFLDAPVTGGPEGARMARLATMVGGDAAALRKVEPLLGAYASTILRVGGPGSGVELKLVNQLLVSTHMSVAGEAVALLGSLGHDLRTSADVLLRGWAQSAMLERTVRQVEHDALQGTGVTVEGMHEVLALVTDLLDGLPDGAAPDRAPVFGAARSTFAAAVLAGLGADDPSSFALHGNLNADPLPRSRS